LSISWRNDRSILEVANAVSEPLRAAAGPGRGDPPLRDRPLAGPGEVAAHYAEDEHTEAAAIAEFIGARWRPAIPRGGEAAPPVTAAVLCRKRAQFQAIRDALRSRGIPVEVVGLGGLLTAPEVTDLVAALQTAHDPSRGDALMRLLTGPRLRLGAADLHALAEWSGEPAGRAPASRQRPDHLRRGRRRRCRRAQHIDAARRPATSGVDEPARTVPEPGGPRSGSGI